METNNACRATSVGPHPCLPPAGEGAKPGMKRGVLMLAKAGKSPCREAEEVRKTTRVGFTVQTPLSSNARSPGPPAPRPHRTARARALSCLMALRRSFTLLAVSLPLSVFALCQQAFFAAVLFVLLIPLAVDGVASGLQRLHRLLFGGKVAGHDQGGRNQVGVGPSCTAFQPSVAIIQASSCRVSAQ